MKHLFYILIISTILVSCTNDYPNRGDEVIKTDLKMTIEVEPSAEVTLKSTRPEDVINSVDVLVFDENNKFMQHLQIDDVQLQNGVYSFYAQLTTTTSARTLHIIANARDTDNNSRVNLSALVAGVSPESALTTLQTNSLSADFIPEITPHIMWGKVSLSNISNAMSTPAIKLIRSVASITLELDANVASEFTLTGFSVHKVAASGMLTPADISASNSVPVAPHLPSTTTYITPDPCMNISTSDRWVFSSDYKKCGDLYIYETTGATLTDEGLSFIICGAPIGAGQSYFYRVSPVGDNGEPMNFVRNHKYKMKITRVDGKGYSTIDGAVSNPPSNIHVEITDEESDFTNVVTDGTNILGTNVNDIYLYANAFSNINVLNYFTGNENAMYSGCFSPVSFLQWTKAQLSSSGNITRYKSMVSTTETLYNPVATEVEVRANGSGGGNSGLAIKVPVSVLPDSRLTAQASGLTNLILGSDNLRSWTATIVNRTAMQDYIQINGADLTDLYKSSEVQQLQVSVKPSYYNALPTAKYLYVELNGVSTDNRIIDRLIVLQISNS